MIDYCRLARSIDFYEKHGFQRVETPWLVAPAVVDITAPKDVVRFELKTKKKELVASGEQGFLYLYLKGFLPLGQFQTVTPCFRDDSFDLSHCKYFMKNELIITQNVCQGSLDNVIETALRFFNEESGGKASVLDTGNESADIVLNGYEIGSYGIRRTQYLTWIYATGLAEPRMTMALEKGRYELSSGNNP